MVPRTEGVLPRGSDGKPFTSDHRPPWQAIVTALERDRSAVDPMDAIAITVSVDAAVAGDITISTPTDTLTGSSDSPFSFDLTVQNGPAEDQTVAATANGPAGWPTNTKRSQPHAQSLGVGDGSRT